MMRIHSVALTFRNGEVGGSWFSNLRHLPRVPIPEGNMPGVNQESSFFKIMAKS